MNIRYLIAFAAAVSASYYVTAEEEGEQTAETKVAEKKPVAVNFDTLPNCTRAEGAAEVQKPGSTEWESAQEGVRYPLGSFFRTRDRGELTLSFGNGCMASIAGNSAFGTQKQGIGVKSRTVILSAGTLELNLTRNLPEGSFVVSAPGFTVRDPAGESKYVYRDLGDGDEAVVRCVTGVMAVEGRHFSIPQMRAADEFRIRTTHDHLETLLYGRSGDYVIKLDQGVSAKNDIDDEGKIKIGAQAATLDWHLSPETKVQINRAVPSIGERMSVHTMCFDPAGALKSECAFCEGRAEVNSGEMIAAEKSASDEAAKRAAAESEEETTTAAEDDGSEKESDKGESEE